jgi:hypothetical protein
MLKERLPIEGFSCEEKKAEIGERGPGAVP